MACRHCKQSFCIRPFYLKCCDALYCETCFEDGCKCEKRIKPEYQSFLADRISSREPLFSIRDAFQTLRMSEPLVIFDLQTKKETRMSNDKKETCTVYFDLEATDINPRTCRIIQIGAVCGSKEFNTKVKADQKINPEASKVTGIKDQDIADAPECKFALIDFFRWVDQVRENRHVVLCAHNGVGYDYILLFSELHRWEMPPYFTLRKHGIVKVVDSLPWARVNIPPHRLIKNMETGEASFRLGDLYESVLGCRFECAHDALADCRALQQFCDSQFVKEKGFNTERHDGHSCYSLKEYVAEFQKRKVAEDSDMLRTIQDKMEKKGCKRTILSYLSSGKRQKV